MKFLRALAFVIVAAPGGLPAFAGAPPSQPECPAPVFSPGDRYEFFKADGDTGIREYVRTDGDTVIIRDEKGIEWRNSKDLDVKRMIQGGYTTTFDPDNGFYRFPLFVGKTYDTSVRIEVWGGYYPGLAESRSKVVAYEKVTVPAGTFDACEVVNQWQSNGAVRKATCWWAPAIHFVVRCDIGYPNPYPSLRLKKYRLGGQTAKTP